MDILNDIFGMPLFPHIYAIPFSMIIGMVIGYKLRGNVELLDEDEKFPHKPEV